MNEYTIVADGKTLLTGDLGEVIESLKMEQKKVEEENLNAWMRAALWIDVITSSKDPKEIRTHAEIVKRLLVEITDYPSSHNPAAGAAAAGAAAAGAETPIGRVVRIRDEINAVSWGRIKPKKSWAEANADLGEALDKLIKGNLAEAQRAAPARVRQASC